MESSGPSVVNSQSSFAVSESDGVFTVTFDRPDLHNAFDDAFIAELTAQFESLASREDIVAVVIAANGKSFSAGADLNWMRRMAGYEHHENLADALALGRMLEALNYLPKPVIARVQGAAFGGGVGLVACCDIAVASETASFCLSEVRLGLVPAMISPYVVDAIGERQARRYFVTAEPFSAARARDMGLVHEVVATDDLDRQVESVLQRIKANGPTAMGVAKRLATGTVGKSQAEALMKHNAHCIADQRASQEGREGIGAFLEKRKPAWTTSNQR